MAEWTPPPRPGTVRRSAGATPSSSGPPGGEGPLVTEGMLARQRDVDRKRREWRQEQETLQEEAREGWTRVWKTVGWVVLVVGLAYAYWRIQSVYQTRWPIGLVWGAMALCLAAGIGWMLWYINKSDL